MTSIIWLAIGGFALLASVAMNRWELRQQRKEVRRLMQADKLRRNSQYGKGKL